MIDHFHVAVPWLMGSASSNLPYIPAIPRDPMQGVVRVTQGRAEVYNGGCWIGMPNSTAYLDMSAPAKIILEWASEKMHEERRQKELAKQHPAVADALAAVQLAEEKLQVVIAITQENK